MTAGVYSMLPEPAFLVLLLQDLLDPFDGYL